MIGVRLSVKMGLFRSSGIGPAERGEDTMMINLTELDNLRAAHESRISDINHNDWMREASARTSAKGSNRMATIVGRMRRNIGEALARGGERFKETPAGHGVNKATVIGTNN
jgi:hypothetical protein